MFENENIRGFFSKNKFVTIMNLYQFSFFSKNTKSK